jgi:hypothetical protein
MKSLTSNNLGKFLVEDCHRIGIKHFIKTYKDKLKSLVLTSQVKAIDEDIKLTTSKTGNGGCRWWFICPICQRRIGVLFQHPYGDLIGCRICLNLEYRKRRYKGMCESQI